MSKPATSDNSSAVGLFPFLAVLLCTMGALLVLLVILAQRIGLEPLVVAAVNTAEGKPIKEPKVDSSEVDELEAELQAIRQYQRKLDELKEQGEQRLEDEQNRLSHLEEHIRRMEHELAEISLAVEQLKATEADQEVDQEQAEKELSRLRQLIKDTKVQLEDMREMAQGDHSYAVVPFKGKNGTYAQPIYIVCDEDGITLQPEGVRFQATDFSEPNWPGNPLAAALRASREYLKEKARRSGDPDPLDPYPLILVRPSGIKYYHIAKQAITSWDASFGYEFIDSEWKLTFPDLADPRLADAQQHAVMISRERLSRLARAAPRKFRGIAGFGDGDDSGQSGIGLGSGGGGSDGRYSSASGEDSEGALGQASSGGENPGSGETDGETRYGAIGVGSSEQAYASMGPYGGRPGEDGVSGEGSIGPEGANGTGEGQAGAGQTAQQGNDNGAEASGVGDQIAYSGASQGGGASSSAGGSATGETNSGSSSNSLTAAGQSSRDFAASSAEASGSAHLDYAKQQSIADARGSDWAIKQAMNNAVPIRRPIQVVVRDNQISLLPSKHLKHGVGATGSVISLDQSLKQISNEFEHALKDRISEWGLAGNGLYWRPVLELHVGPEADQTAQRLIRLLKNSGVDVRLPETANSQRGQGAHGSR